MKISEIFGTIIVIVFLIVMVYKSNTRDISEDDECKYSYAVADIDSSNMGFTNQRPDKKNGCVETTTRIFCGTMSLVKTKKGTDYCKKN